MNYFDGEIYSEFSRVDIRTNRIALCIIGKWDIIVFTSNTEHNVADICRVLNKIGNDLGFAYCKRKS